MQSRPAPALRHSATPRPRRSPRASNRSQLKKIRPIRAIRPSRTTGYFAMRPAADFGFYFRRNFQFSAQNKMRPAQRVIGNAPRAAGHRKRAAARAPSGAKPMQAQRQQLQRGGQIQAGAQAQMQSAPTRTRKAGGRLATGRLSKNCKFSARPKKNAARQTAAKRFFQNATP